MKLLNIICILLFIIVIGINSIMASPQWGAFEEAKSLGILTDGIFTGTPTTIINGDVGYTALASTPTINGSTYAAPDAMYTAAIADKNAAKAALNDEACDYQNAAAVDLYNDATHYTAPNNMGSLNVYTPGVYCIGGAMSITGDITLSGTGAYVFKAVGALSTAAGVDILLTNEAEVCDIFWLGASFTTGASSSVNGTLISNTTIVLGANNSINGRLFANAITTAADTLITVPVCDFTPPFIQSTTFASGTLFPGGIQHLFMNYSDMDSGIDTASDIISLYKWDGITWGSDIFATGLNLGSKVITTTGSSYTTNNLVFGKYKYDFTISDNAENSSSTGGVFYIDTPEMIINTGSFYAGGLSSPQGNFSSGEITITIKTVGAPFNLTLNKSSAMNDLNGNEIIDWDGTQGIGYDIEPYSNSIYNINNNEILASEALNININGDQNIHIYNLKIGSMIDYEQISGIYQSNIDFGINLTY